MNRIITDISNYTFVSDKPEQEIVLFPFQLNSLTRAKLSKLS